ncbi:protein required for cyt b6 assembly [Dunaliella salina]|uniref:Protein required for cyt b6 assembly n=1 Tax=Dunaliella salina TaxID=3046 RepID=A0ABQ7FYR0_DUNSA|nr:protein required for cyt b6 assembly [Dunaliella salina]|eukprot:KAF5827481.1 protein required for cyt b6 assembly [Dunaliella salina]
MAYQVMKLPIYQQILMNNIQMIRNQPACCSGRSTISNTPLPLRCCLSTQGSRWFRGNKGRSISRLVRYAQNGGGSLGDEEGMDMAVFRFTLGIPGFEDRYIPRVVGGLGASLVLINHFLAAQVAPPSQVRGEFICIVLAAVCALAPDLEERLKQALPGRGRQATSANIPGAVNGFAFELSVQDAAKAELAWASFALIKNTNSCGVILLGPGQKVLLARGALGSSVLTPGSPTVTLERMSQDLSQVTSQSEVAGLLSGQAAASSGGSSQQLYLPDLLAMARVGANRWASVPQGAQSLLLQRVGGGNSGKPAGLLMVYSERPRALSVKELLWIGEISAKLTSALNI